MTAAAHREAAPENLAKRGGRCPLCPNQIRPGEHYIAKIRPGWAHAFCTRAYRTAVAENEEAA